MASSPMANSAIGSAILVMLYRALAVKKIVDSVCCKSPFAHQHYLDSITLALTVETSDRNERTIATPFKRKD